MDEVLFMGWRQVVAPGLESRRVAAAPGGTRVAHARSCNAAAGTNLPGTCADAHTHTSPTPSPSPALPPATAHTRTHTRALAAIESINAVMGHLGQAALELVTDTNKLLTAVRRRSRRRRRGAAHAWGWAGQEEGMEGRRAAKGPGGGAQGGMSAERVGPGSEGPSTSPSPRNQRSAWNSPLPLLPPPRACCTAAPSDNLTSASMNVNPCLSPPASPLRLRWAAPRCCSWACSPPARPPAWWAAPWRRGWAHPSW